MKSNKHHTQNRNHHRSIAEQLSRRFGSSGAVFRDGIKAVLDSADGVGRQAFSRWRELFPHLTGRNIEQLSQVLRPAAERFGVSPRAEIATMLLFSMQSYYCLLAELTAERFAGTKCGELLPESPFAWCAAAKSKPLGRLAERLRNEIAGLENDPAHDGAIDWFKTLYQDIFPRRLRHRLGEYYTPDWLAEHVLDQIGYDGDPASSLLDPACGSGTFLMAALRRSAEWRVKTGEIKGKEVASGQWPVASDGIAATRSSEDIASRKMSEASLATRPSSLSTLHSPPSTPAIVGFDLNPLAVLTARANYLIAVAALFPDIREVEPPIYLHDSILGRGEAPDDAGPFDFVVGNPPWIAWDNLPDEDRQATKPLWERYGLFSLGGKEARHGGGKKDLSMLMLHAAADRYLKRAGRLGMVITQSVFQTIGAGDGFRRFRLGPDGEPLRVLRVDDMTELRPFDAAARTSTIIIEKGEETRYPVRYVKWRKGERGEGREEREKRREKAIRTVSYASQKGWALQCPVELEPCEASPVDSQKPTSPWLIEKTRKNTAIPLAVSQTRPAYTAHLGANSGGANGAYWLEVLEPRDGGLLVRNLASAGKRRLETVEAVIEPDLVYPLLRWGDVARYRAEPRCHILLAQNPTTRSGIAEQVMREKYPRTLEYLARFRETLTARQAYRRYQHRGPFYSMYNVGSYTVAPIKVVWRRMDRRINAAVIEPAAESARPTVAALWDKTFVPQETCVLVECESSDEAHYLCAMLNSDRINELAAAQGIVGGKSFGSPGMLKHLPIEQFNPDNLSHIKLATSSRQSHSIDAIDLQRSCIRYQVN